MRRRSGSPTPVSLSTLFASSRRLGVPKWLAAVLLVVAALAAWRFAPGDGAPHGGTRYALSGSVVEVADGDTVTLATASGRRRIRLASVDAPEKGGDGRPGQPYGSASGRHLASLLADAAIQARCYEQDHYGRDVCDLLLPDGTTASRRQVEAGMAWVNMQGNGRYLRDQSLLALQEEARRSRRGLWSQAGAVEPWVWRQRCWNQKQC